MIAEAVPHTAGGSYCFSYPPPFRVPLGLFLNWLTVACKKLGNNDWCLSIASGGTIPPIRDGEAE